MTEVTSGVRKFTDKDFLRLKERAHRKRSKLEENNMNDCDNVEDYSEYLNVVHQELVDKKRGIVRQLVGK